AWNPEAHQLFNWLDPDLYERIGNNPISLIESIDMDKFKEVSENENYLYIYEDVINKFKKYLNSTQSLVPSDPYITAARPVVYFSMEYGIHESLPIYSGGLGILSGDHIKSSSDLNIPLVGVGLLYRKGYFKQGISIDGQQKVNYFNNDFNRLPLKEVKKRNKSLIIPIDFPGRIVHAKVWKLSVGRTSVYLLDTDILENSLSDREITSRLYGGGKKVRIEQEIVLGIGGVKLIQELNITPSVYHINEGHSAFLILQRFVNQVKYNKLDFDTARELIRSSTVFTTHTPVPAGNETFDYQMVENYMKHYVEANGLSWQQFNDMSGREFQSNGNYEMTVLALKNTLKRNGVSKLHGAVSRKMWSHIWQGFLQEEIPIDHITNGIHVSSWLHSEIRNLLLKYQAIDYQKEQLSKDFWNRISKIPDKEIWQTHFTVKSKFFSYIKDKIRTNWTREGEEPAKLDNFLQILSPAPLTIGFARRFATYKRATLLFNDFKRLKRIILNEKYPVQIIFAGKAHPDDVEGAKLIKEIVSISKKPEFLGKIIFLEDYDIKLARKLVSGVDVWLNNPVRPYEASGTSGMKAGINGVINCSILDGWWDEGFDGSNGWAIGEQLQFKNPETQNIFDSESFYDTLEGEIIPAYYNRNSEGIPQQWVERMKRSMITILGEFNTHRMVRDYMEKLYLPAAKKFYECSQNNYQKANAYSDWIKSVRTRFASVHIQNINLKGRDGDVLNVNDTITVMMEINKGKLDKSELKAQLIVVKDSAHDSIGYQEKVELKTDFIQTLDMTIQSEDGDVLTYSCDYVADKSGKFNYGLRVLPYYQDCENPTDINLIYWA
ncbi:alpha-glucan family phosphorylase, partial [Bacteroidota bacterium]